MSSKGLDPSIHKYPENDTKPADSEDPVQEHLKMPSTSLFTLLTGQL